MLLKLKYN